MKTRITVTGQVVFQPMVAQPTDFTIGFSRWLISDEQPWLRKLRVGLQWQPLDVGWLKNTGVAYLLLRNDSGLSSYRLSDEQRAEEAKMILQVGLFVDSGCIVPFAQCRPGECGIQIDPVNLNSWYIRATCAEIVHATLFAIPS